MRLAALVLAVLVPALARADLSASYDAAIAATPRHAAVQVSGTLAQTGTALSGTLAVASGDAALDGSYPVAGTVVGRRVRLRGLGAGGARLAFRGTTPAGGGVRGRLRVRAGRHHVVGRLVLAAATSSAGDATSCDAVFGQNQAFFVDQVMGQVLEPICAACHVAGGLAQAARLRVTASDPLATARSVALLVDGADPAASRLLQKPLGLLPHGGGTRLQAGSAQAQILAQWASLVASAHCTSSAPPPTAGSGADTFVAQCSSCHGADASGAGAAPDIRCSAKSRLVDAVRRGRGAVMPRFAPSDLPASALADLVAYVGGLCGGEPASVYAGNCSTCHGASAAGGRNADGVGGPNIRCAGGELGEALQGGEGMPAFPDLGGARVAAVRRFLGGFCGR